MQKKGGRVRFGLLCICLVLLQASAVFCQDKEVKTGAALDQAVEEAIDAQETEGDVAQVAVKAQVVTQEGPAELANGDGDLDLKGDCKLELDEYCIDVKAGEGRLAKCLSAQLKEEAKDTFKGKKTNKACIDELDQFKLDRSLNINKDLPLAKACKADTTKLCAKSADAQGGVLACLRSHKDELSEGCSAEVFARQEEAADDFRTDKELYRACKSDAEVNCKDIEPREGKIQECLRAKRTRLTWDCQEQLFRQEVENADDIRLSGRLFKVCLNNKKKFCADVQPGNARAKECLEEHRLDAGFTTECKDEIEKMIAERAADFRLDSQLRELCADDIEDLCGYEKDSLDTVAGYDARVIQCLQDFKDDLQSQACKGRVHKVMQLASSDIRFDVPLAVACYDDRVKYCNNVPPGSARVIRCLQDRREKLSDECKATLFDQEVIMAESIDFQFPMAQMCTAEITKFCTGVPHGAERVIRCLQDNIEQTGFGADCKKEVQQHDEHSGQDFRLKYRLNRACREVISEKCSTVCQLVNNDEPCAGRVLRCLTENLETIENEECKNEVLYFEKMEVRDFRNDVILAEACRKDVDSFCAIIVPGEGRVHACLRENRARLSEACRSEESRIEQIESSNTELMPKLTTACAAEREAHCPGVRPGKARVFNCLVTASAAKDFSEGCRAQLSRQMESRVRDWRLDYNLFQACRGDVPKVCAAAAKEDDKANGAAFKCLVKETIGESELLSETCSSAVSRSIKNALQFYQPGLPVTDVCDEDISKACQQSSAIGKVRACLLDLAISSKGNNTEDGPAHRRRLAAAGGNKHVLTPPCSDIVLLSSPDDIYNAYQATLDATAVATQFKAIEATLGLKEGTLIESRSDKRPGITLTGWSALAGMCALLVVLVVGGVMGYRRYKGYDSMKGYTMVNKGRGRV